MKTATRAKPSRAAATRGKIDNVAWKKLRLRKILVPVDFSKPSLAAIDYASKVAGRFGAEVNLVHVFELQYGFSGVPELPIVLPDREIAIQARAHLETAAKRHKIPLRAEHIHVKQGCAFEEICELARKIDIDLIIIPTRGRTGLKHLALGSTAERVVRHSPCPVLILRSTGKVAGKGKLPAAAVSFRKILVPIDFSESSMRALNYARDFGAVVNASTLVLLNSVNVQYYVTSDEYARYDYPELAQESEKAARKEMADLLGRGGWGDLKLETTVECGHAGQQICDRAKDRHVDLIITATHGRTGLKHILIGSTAEYVVRHAEIPVLVIPTREQAANKRP